MRAYIEAVLGLKPIPVSTGVFFVFKREQDEQDFLLRRFDSTRSLAVLPPSKRPVVIQKLREDRFERLAPVLEHLADEMRRLGRRLFSDELSPELVDQMRAYRVSKKTAEAILARAFSKMIYKKFLSDEKTMFWFIWRRSNLTVPRYSKLSARLKGDIKVGWGNYANVQNEARRLLFFLNESHR